MSDDFLDNIKKLFHRVDPTGQVRLHFKINDRIDIVGWFYTDEINRMFRDNEDVSKVLDGYPAGPFKLMIDVEDMTFKSLGKDEVPKLF